MSQENRARRPGGSASASRARAAGPLPFRIQTKGVM